jgi:hypothetical protein
MADVLTNDVWFLLPTLTPFTHFTNNIKPCAEIADTQTVSLHERLPNSSEQDPNTGNDDEQAVRQRDLDRKRLFALIGSAISQFPIWGWYVTYPNVERV